MHSGKTAYLFFLDSLKFSLEREHFLSKFGQKNSGCFLKTAKYVRRRTIWYFFPRKYFFISLCWAQNFQVLSNFFAEKVFSFSFFVSGGPFGSLFPREISSSWTVALNIRVLAEKFSSVFSKVPSRCERERSCFSVYSNFFSWNLRIIFRRLGKKLGTFLNAAKYLCRRTICHLFPEKKLFISLLWARNRSDSKKTSPKKYSVFHFLCAENILVLFTRDLGFFWTWA